MTCGMPIVEHLVRILVAAERQSAERAVVMDLHPVGAGAQRPGAPAIGRVTAQNGRICWAMARGHDLTLTEVLAADSGVPVATFERIYEAARSERVPFCEKLADSDVIDVGAVRRALASQAASCLATLARNDARARLELSVGRMPPFSYDDQFTFGALELLQTAIHHSAELRAEAGSAPPFFAALCPELDAAICLREWDAGDALAPVATWRLGEFGLNRVMSLALEGLAKARPEDALAEEIAPFALLCEGGECWLSAWQAPHLALFRIRSRKQYHAILEKLLAARRGAGD